jgi:CDGSH-type Zn-finger protein
MADRHAGGQIVACPNGPLIVRGDVEIVGASGTSIDRGRRTVALCRCGVSGRKPFCDGTHKITGFRTDDSAQL